jgi:hypothetical protein
MPGDALSIRALRAEDADDLVRCFARCYDGTYPGEAFHDAARLAALVAEERLRSVVAVAPGAGIVGHMGITLHAPGARSGEWGNTVVDPRHRGHDLAARLGVALAARGREAGLVGLHGYPTTVHPVMQKLHAAGGGVETGLLFDYIPAGTRYVGIPGEREGRIPVVAFYNALDDAPERDVLLPARYVGFARERYPRMRCPRKLRAPEASLMGAVKLDARYEARRGLLRLAVEATGVDLGERLRAELRARDGAAALLDLPLADPGVGAATEAARGEGFFFGAILPEYAASGDVLRLQRPAVPATSLPLATPGGEEALAACLADALE